MSKIEGIDKLSKQLKTLGPAVGGKVLRQAIRAAGKPIKDAAQDKAPVGDGGLHRTYRGRLVAPGFLRRNVRLATFLGRDKRSARVSIGVRGEAFYGVQFVELGTSKQAKQPWLRPALRAGRKAAIERFKKKMKLAIEKAAK